MGTHGMMMGGGSSTSKKIFNKAQISLFDNIKKQFIKYGYVNESAQGLVSV